MGRFVFSVIATIFLLVPADAEGALLGRWKLDEGTGSTATDSSGNGKHGTWSGTSSGNTGYYDTNATSSLAYSGSFSSGDDQVLITGITTVVKSVTFWAYIPNLDGTTEMVSKSTSGQGFEVIINGGTIQFYTMGSDVTPATASSGDIDLNAWNHIVATYNGGGTTMRLYINGDLSGSTATAPATVTNVENLYFGTWGSGGRQFVGKLNDIRLYDVQLTETQVENVMGGSVDPDTPPDSTAPTISSVSAAGTSNGATVTWTTNEAASTKVIYGTGSATSNASTTAETDTSTRVTSHSATISNLLSCASYVYKVVSRDAAGNSATSTDMTTFSTTGCPGGASPSTSLGTVSAASPGDGVTGSMGGRSLKVDPPDNFTDAADSVVLQVSALSASTVLGSIGKPSSSLSTGSTQVFQAQALINNTTLLDSFDLPVSLTFTYLDSDISSLDESTLKMYHYSGSTWTELTGCTHDTAANTIQCETDSFSIFAIFGSEPEEESDSGRSYGYIRYGCKDKNATNYDYFTSHRADLCIYAHASPQALVEIPTQVLCPRYEFTRWLRVGSTGEDVRGLQRFLNCAGFKLAQSGPGAPGAETSNFAERTYAALVAFQEAYAEEVLKPIGAQKGTGIFANLSRAKAASLMLP